MKVFITADLHYDLQRDNEAEIDRISQELIKSNADIFIIAGDTVGLGKKKLPFCLEKFRAFKGKKLFLPGNHDIWVPEGDSYEYYTITLRNLIEDLGFQYLDANPYIKKELAIVGNIGWYDYSFRDTSLDVPMKYYKNKSWPGQMSWNDRIFVLWKYSDEEFLDNVLNKMREHLIKAENQSDKILVVTHHLAFKEMAPIKEQPKWKFGSAFLGSQKMGELMLKFPKVKYYVCGHSHHKYEFQKEGIHCYNVGSTYEKEFCTARLLTEYTMEKLSILEDYMRKVRNGYHKMKQSNIAICSIVRDCGEALQKNIPVIEQMRGLFADSSVIIVENDSKDHTREVLQKWSQNAKNVHIISETLGVKTLPNFSKKGVHRGFSKHRITLMSSFRNKYIEKLKDIIDDLDYVIVVDLDVDEIIINGIANSFGQDIDWDVIASNSKGIIKETPFAGYLYYDTYAFEEFAYRAPQTEQSIYTYQNTLKDLTTGMPIIRVNSAFGGLAIYKAKAIKNMKYRCQENNDPRVEVYCEHISLHTDIAQKGYNAIFLNPSQIIYYQTIKTYIKSRLKRLISLPIRYFTA